MDIKTELNDFINSEVLNRDFNCFNRFKNDSELIYDLNSPKSFRISSNEISVARLSFNIDPRCSVIKAVLHVRTLLTGYLFKARLEVVNNEDGVFYRLTDDSFEELIKLLEPKKASMEVELRSLLGTTDVLTTVKELVKENEILKTQNLLLIKKLKSLKVIIDEDF